MKRNPHPARRARITALGISSTAFVSVVTSFAWNTHQAELAANVVDVNGVPVQQTSTDANGNLVPVTTASSSPVAPGTPTATIAPTTQPAPTKKGSSSAATVAPATPAAPAATKTPAVAPAAPTATVVYTCMSPGGKTENPTATGQCKNAKYGYVLTQV